MLPVCAESPELEGPELDSIEGSFVSSSNLASALPVPPGSSRLYGPLALPAKSPYLQSPIADCSLVPSNTAQDLLNLHPAWRFPSSQLLFPCPAKAARWSMFQYRHFSPEQLKRKHRVL